MKFKCPYCNEEGISVFAKFGATALSPARCARCGKQSEELSRYRWFSALYWSIGFFSVIYISIVYQYYFAVGAYIVVGFISSCLALFLLPLKTIAEGQRKQTKVVLYIFIGLMALGIISAVLEN